MIRNHLRIALRNLTRQKFYSFINIFGLAIGITATILIAMFVKHELSFDKFHSNSDRIVKANLEYMESGGSINYASVSPPILLSAFQNEFPEVVGGVRLFNPSMFKPPVVKLRNESFEESGFWYADSTFFRIFSFDLIEGDIDRVLENPNSLVLTRSASAKYFPISDPVGELITVDGREYLITGVMEDLPDNSHFQFTMLASFSSHPASRRESWGGSNYMTYLLLVDGESREKLQAKIQPYLQKIGLSDPEQDDYLNFDLVPLEDIYLYSSADSLSDVKYVYIFSGIAFLILLIACINYVNLSTARSSSRAKEVGVRKSIGATKTQLIAQFLIESVLIAFMAVGISLLLVYLVLPLFNGLTGKSFTYSDFINIQSMLAMFGVSLVAGLFAGIYPSLIISSFKPSEVLKGDFKTSSSGSWLRKSLVVFQFGISVFLIMSTIVVNKQLNFIQSKKLGYNRDNVIYVPVSRELVKKGEVFKNEMTKYPGTGIESISFSGETPTKIMGGYSIWAEGMPQDKSSSITAVAVDEDYLSTLNLKLVTGNNISSEDIQRLKEIEEYQFIINTTALEAINLTIEEAVGRKVVLDGREGFIKGVIEDFHFKPLHQQIGPLILFTEREWGYYVALLKMSGPASPTTLNNIENKWKQVAEGEPFTYKFLDDEYNRLYQSEMRMSGIFGVFAMIAIAVACLGLLGLISFTTVQRSKEIGIRKVLGATVGSMINLMAKDFGKLVVIAFLLAAPIAYIVMENWLEGFEYRTPIGAVPVLTAFVLAFAIAGITISYHIIKSATANPVDVLKDE